MTTTTNRIAAINSSATDYMTDAAVRISAPVYADLTTSQRKALLNAARTVANHYIDSTPHTQSGIVVSTSNGGLSRLEQYLGCSFEVLRHSLFARGGVSLELILKLQIASGVEFISIKEVEAALKSKMAVIKEYVAQNPFTR